MQPLHGDVKSKVRSRKAIFQRSGRYKNAKFPLPPTMVAAAWSHRMTKYTTGIGKILVSVSGVPWAQLRRISTPHKNLDISISEIRLEGLLQQKSFHQMRMCLIKNDNNTLNYFLIIVLEWAIGTVM